jgi:hypothetical protein
MEGGFSALPTELMFDLCIARGVVGLSSENSPELGHGARPAGWMVLEQRPIEVHKPR